MFCRITFILCFLLIIQFAFGQKKSILIESYKSELGSTINELELLKTQLSTYKKLIYTKIESDNLRDKAYIQLKETIEKSKQYYLTLNKLNEGQPFAENWKLLSPCKAQTTDNLEFYTEHGNPKKINYPIIYSPLADWKEDDLNLLGKRVFKDSISKRLDQLHKFKGEIAAVSSCINSNTILLQNFIALNQKLIFLNEQYYSKWITYYEELESKFNSLQAEFLKLDNSKYPKNFKAVFDSVSNSSMVSPPIFEVPIPIGCGGTLPVPKPEINDFVDVPAEFPGGMDSLRLFIKNNLVYPESAIYDMLQGKCYLKFVVSKNGFISNVKIKKGVTDCPTCDEEAIRLVKSMPNWIPGKVNNEYVNSYFHLPITFKLTL